MKIINKVHNEVFGELLAFAKDNGSPLFWGKKIKMKFLSKEEQEVIVALNLYCFDEKFQSDGWDQETIDKVIKNVYEEYQIFLKDNLEMDERFIQAFNEEKEEWDIESDIITKEDLYKKVQVIQVDIVKESYVISFVLDDEEWALVKIDRKETPSYSYINPRRETQFAEMDY